MVGEAHAEAVGLHAVVALAPDPRRVSGDERQKAAGGIARLPEGIDRHGPVVLVVEDAYLIAVPRLVVDVACLAAHTILHAGGRHQIALVGCVDEDLARVPPRWLGRSGKRRDRHDSRAHARLAAWLHLDPLLSVEQRPADNRHALLLEPPVEDPLGDVRLEEPHRVVANIGLLQALSKPFE